MPATSPSSSEFTSSSLSAPFFSLTSSRPSGRKVMAHGSWKFFTGVAMSSEPMRTAPGTSAAPQPAHIEASSTAREMTVDGFFIGTAAVRELEADDQAHREYIHVLLPGT